VNITGGSTDVTTYFVLRTAADGTATTGATITNIDLQYVRTGAAPSAKVDATALAATDSAHADNKAIEIDATDAPGLYRVDWPDAAFAAGVKQVILSVKLASSFTEHMAVEIDPPVGVAASVTGAVGSVTGAVGSVTGAVGSVTGAVGSVTGAVGSVAGNVDGSTASVTGAVGSVTGAVGSVTGAVGSVTGAVGSVAGNVDGSTASVTAGVSLANDAITAVKFDQTTAWPANEAIVTYKLDHLVYVADGDDPADNSIMAKIAASDGDWSGFSAATDSLEAVRDQMDTAHALLATPAQVATALTTYDGPTKGEMDTAHALLATPAQVATALTTYDGPTKGEMDTAHALLATPAQVATALTTYDAPTKAELDSGLAGLNDASTAEIMTALWAETPTVGGVTTFQSIVKGIWASIRGRVAKDTNDYEYYDDDGDAAGGTKLFENRISSSARTPQ